MPSTAVIAKNHYKLNGRDLLKLVNDVEREIKQKEENKSCNVPKSEEEDDLVKHDDAIKHEEVCDNIKMKVSDKRVMDLKVDSV